MRNPHIEAQATSHTSAKPHAQGPISHLSPRWTANLRTTSQQDAASYGASGSFEKKSKRRVSLTQAMQLTKEDEVAAGGEENEVRREDQDKINRFSRLHQKEKALEEELKTKQKDKEDLEEVSTELELVDEDDKVPYKIGDAFVSLPQPEVLELLGTNTEAIEKEVSILEDKLSTVRDEMDELKVALYARFGRSINLET
ncbi:hypothetical protein K490DRAFT_42727 [Saccharata proteae CBS 121410]|uniref:Prefoldin subunit 4 n=1 Tax=Saccharata proteae CBS 121410 TaxID=1314787 RepID=A0A9P4HVD1_9PEZI|nr:hypothetical protein K490DRAFT_42727 [Saccharata proteae CBS 121410]